MILIDYSQVFLAPIHLDGAAKSYAQAPSAESKDAIFHYVVNTIRALQVQFKKKYGSDVVIACDSVSWRRSVFPQYKHTRKNRREEDTSGIDWKFVSEVEQYTKEMLTKYFPYIVISTPGAEGDDVIGVMTKYISTLETEETNLFGESEPEPILIISSDKDNFQLHKYKNVKQYSNIQKSFVGPTIKPEHALLEKIVTGDSGDSIMNIKTHDNFYVEHVKGGSRQASISKKYLQKFFDSKNPIDACENEVDRINFKRNQQIVSYEFIPDEINTAVIESYWRGRDSLKSHSKMKLMSFFTEHRMNVLLSKIGDFY